MGEACQLFCGPCRGCGDPCTPFGVGAPLAMSLGGKHLPEGRPLLAAGRRRRNVNVLFLCRAGKRLERRLREGDPVGGEGKEFGEGLGQKLVPLHGGGTAQVVRIVPFVHPH